LAQALHLFNSEELQEKIAGKGSPQAAEKQKEMKPKKNAPAPPGIAVKNGGTRVAQIVSDTRTNRSSVISIWSLSPAKPSAVERAALLAPHRPVSRRFARGQRCDHLGYPEHQGISTIEHPGNRHVSAFPVLIRESLR